MTSKSTIMQTKQLPQRVSAWTPHNYQKKAMKFMLRNSSAGLFLDPGLGKTSITLGVLKVLKSKGMLRKCLIIAPLRVCYNVWPEEAEKWSDFHGLSGVILHGDRKELNLQKDFDVYLINPEGLQWLFGEARTLFKKAKFDVLVIDESSKFKNPTSKRFRALRPLLERFARRYILTGSPAPNSLLDVFGQIYVLDLGERLGKFISHFRSRYFFQTGWMGKEWAIMPGCDKEVHAKIKDITLRMDAEDYLDMPELIVNPIYLDLDPKSRAAYEEMEEELLTAINNHEIAAVSAAVASSKCAQIANGGIYDEDSKYHFIHDIKSEAVQELIEELQGNPALVAYEFGHDLTRLQNMLGKKTPYIGGGVSPKQSQDIVSKWNTGTMPVLLGQPASVAHGLNLQNAGNHVIWHSITWNFEHYDQFNRRIRRQGSKHDKIFVHHLIMRDTVDELKIMALNRKFRTQKDLFDALKTFLQRRH